MAFDINVPTLHKYIESLGQGSSKLSIISIALLSLKDPTSQMSSSNLPTVGTRTTLDAELKAFISSNPELHLGGSGEFHDNNPNSYLSALSPGKANASLGKQAH